MNKKAWIAFATVAVVIVVAVFLSIREPQADTITIGAILPLTGDAAQWGIPPQKAALLAVEEINSEGGVAGKRLVLSIEDSKAEPKEGVSAFNKIMATSDVKVVLGAVASSVTLAIAPLAERNHIVLFSPASTSPKITEAGEFIFRNIPTDALRGKVFAEYVFSHAKISKVAVLYINNDAGVGNKDAFANRFKELGGIALGEEAYSQGTRDVRTQLTKVAALNPQAIMVVSYLEDAIVVVKQARELLPGMQLFFQTEAIEDPSVREALGSALEGVTYILPAKPEGDVPQRFINAYEKRYGKEPELFAAESYDCIRLIADAIRASGGNVDAPKIRDNLYLIKGYVGASGLISFDSNGDVIKPMAVKRIESGEPTVIYTSR